jgi:toxin-antitoxin system PIN domain toxin
VIAVDTNLLVYAHRRDAEFHEEAASRVRELAEGGAAWAIPWPCVHEFLAIATHPRIFDPPSTRGEALDQVEAWLASPSVRTLGEGPGYLEHLTDAVEGARATGGAVHDARIAALCSYHGIGALWSADRDFSRYPALRVVNPLSG